VIRCEEKILTAEKLREVVAQQKSVDRRIVFAWGSFDLLHVGHVRYLEAARSLGDTLVVAVNEDSTVRGLKGADRPVMSLDQRKRVLGGLECVDYVVDISGDGVADLVRELRPDVVVEREGNEVTAGGLSEVVEGIGAEIRTIAADERRASADIMERIRASKSRV